MHDNWEPCPSCGEEPNRWDMVELRYPQIAQCTNPDCRVWQFEA